MMLPGIALNFGSARSKIRVRIGQIEVTATAATEINATKVTVAYIADSNSYIVWGNSAPKSDGITRKTISRKSPKNSVRSKNYRVKIVALVDNQIEEKWEVWLYGDRPRPTKIYEADKKIDEFNEFGAVSLPDVVLDNTGKKQKDWEVFVKISDNSENITLPTNIIDLLPENFDNSTFYEKNYSVLIRQNNTVLYDGNYASNLEYKGGYAVIRNDLLIDTASEPRNYSNFELNIAEEETTLYEWDFSGLEEESNIPLILYLDKGLNEQTGDSYVPLDEISTAEFMFPETYQFPSFDSVLELNNFSISGDFEAAIISTDISNFRVDPYAGGGNFSFFGTLVAGGFDFSNFSEGVKKYISDIYPRPAHLVRVREEEFIFTNPTFPYFFHISQYTFSLFTTGRLGFDPVRYNYSLVLEKSHPNMSENFGVPIFSYNDQLIINYLFFEIQRYIVDYRSSNPFQTSTPTARRYETFLHFNGSGSYLLRNNSLDFLVNKISTFIEATFQSYQFVDSVIPSLHLNGKNSFIISEYIIRKNDSLPETERSYRYWFYLLEAENWTKSEIVDYSVLEEDGKLNTPKEFFTLKGRILSEVIDDEKLTQTLTRKTQINMRTYLINSQGVIEERGLKKAEVLPLKKQGIIKSACFY